MPQFRVTLAAMMLLLAAVNARSQPVPDAEAQWLQGLRDAKWSTSMTEHCVVHVRQAAVFDAPFLGAIRREGTPDAPDLAPLADLIRVTALVPGWLEGVLVDRGVYTFGLHAKQGQLRLLLRNAEGKVINEQGFWVEGHTDVGPAVSLAASSGRADLSVAWKGISINVPFVSKAAHDAAAEGLHVTRKGRVALFTDLEAVPLMETLCAELDAAVAVNARLLGAALPEGVELRHYLVADRERHQALNHLVARGMHAGQPGYTANSVRQSYGWHFTLNSPEALAHGLPAVVRETAIHELHHQYARHALPSFSAAPLWLQEGLADHAVYCGLARIDQKAADQFMQNQRAEVSIAGATGRLNLEDMFVWKPGTELKALYLSAWALVTELDQKAGRLPGVVKAVADHWVDHDAARTARRELDRHTPDAAAVLRKAAHAGAGARRVHGGMDHDAAGWRLTSSAEGAALAMLPVQVKGDRVKFNGEFRWHGSQGNQADFTLGMLQGANTERYLKLAVLPARIVLFANDDGNWRTLGSVNYDTDLARGTETEPVWHKFELTMDARAETVRFETTGGRWCQFQLNEYWPVRGSFCGMGVYNGMAWFRGLKVA